MRPLPCPVPPADLLRACFHYTGTARYIALFWEPAGDEAMCTDGQITFASQPDAFRLYAAFLWEQYGVDTWLFGSSEDTAHSWLIIDLQEQQLLMDSVPEARQFLARQWPQPEMPVLKLTHLNDIQKLLDQYLEKIATSDPEVLLSTWREDYQHLQDLYRWMQNQSQGNEVSP